jgi:hypothetical protein
MNDMFRNVAIAFAALVLGVSFFLLIRTERLGVTSGPSPGTEGAQRAERCNDQGRADTRPLVLRTDKAAREALVDQSLWASAEPEVREDVAAWVSLCELDGEDVAIRDAKTGRLLATYSPGDGYEATDVGG